MPPTERRRNGDFYESKINAESLLDLKDDAFYSGGTFAVGEGVGIDFSAIPTEDRAYYGITVAVLFGGSAEAHIGASHSVTIIGGNIYEIYEKYIKKKYGV